MRKTTTLALLLALALLLPAAAAGQALAPPGNSEADQYFETLPASTGPRGPVETKKARDAVLDGALTEATEKGLRQRGPAGLGLATGVAKTAPPGGPGGGPSPGSAVRIPGGQGLGALFPFALAITAAAALAFAVARRRRAVAR